MTGAGACVVIPTLNEINHIEGLLAQLLAEPQTTVGEILVADGGSEDGTRDIVRSIAVAEPRVHLIDNPDRVQAAGVNRAVGQGDHRFATIVRVDAHALYPEGYVGKLLASMAATGADSVVVRMETVGRNCLQRAIAVASNSKIGTGGSAHRMARGSGFVDHGHHAAISRTLFERAGGYDASFEANEDAELDARLRALGGRIWLDADIPVTYFPRASLRSLSRQYRRYGSGRARTFLKHGERLRLRQMLPPIAFAGALAGLLLAPFVPIMLMVPAGYFAAILASAVLLAVSARSPCILLTALVLPTMHFAWGAAFLGRLITNWRRTAEILFRRNRGAAAAPQQTPKGAT